MEQSLPVPRGGAGRRNTPAALDELAALVAVGNTAAFECIYGEIADDLFIFLRGQCRSDVYAEDLLANVFLKAWRFGPRYRKGSNTYRQWLFAIARNEVRDQWRLRLPTVALGDLDFPDGQDPHDSRESEWAAICVSRALEMLTPLQRQVVVLRYFGDKSHAQIAEVLGKREGAVRGLLNRALQRMRKVVRDAAE